MTDEPEPKEEAPPAPPQPPTMIDEANTAAMRLEAASAKMEEQLRRLEAAQVERRLGGKASVNVEKAEETDADYAEKALAGELDEKKA